MNKKEYGVSVVAHTAQVFLELFREASRQQSGYQFRPSTHSLREQAERDSVLARRMVAEGNELELMAILHGYEPESSDGKLLTEAWKAYDQRNTIRHTSRGDFCHLHVNPLICK